jgi:hypothetical protein
MRKDTTNVLLIKVLSKLKISLMKTTPEENEGGALTKCRQADRQ